MSSSMRSMRTALRGTSPGSWSMSTMAGGGGTGMELRRTTEDMYSRVSRVEDLQELEGLGVSLTGKIAISRFPGFGV